MNKLAFIILLLLPGAALAQTFPADGDWTPLTCGQHAMRDATRDQTGALDERDIVGTDADPAGFRAVDADFLYLRMRVDVDPAPGGTITPYAWGMELDLDGDLTTYELLLMADGVSGEVLIFTNHTTTVANSAADPADTPAADTFPLTTHGKVSLVGDDAYVSIAVPWSALMTLGLDRDQPTHVWAATSGTSARLDGDVACVSGPGGLDDAASDPTVLDPDVDSDGDGYSDDDEVHAGSDPGDPASHPGAGVTGDRLAGGGGCDVGDGNEDLAMVLMVLAAVFLHGRLRRRQG